MSSVLLPHVGSTLDSVYRQHSCSTHRGLQPGGEAEMDQLVLAGLAEDVLHPAWRRGEGVRRSFLARTL